MKILLKISFFILSVWFHFSCADGVKTPIGPVDPGTDPALEIKIVSPQPGEFVYTNGYDSTGVLEPVPSFANMIVVNGVVNSFDGWDRNIGHGEVVFYDRNNPVHSPRQQGQGHGHGEGRRGPIIGYQTRKIGQVSFNGYPATIVPAKINFLDNQGERDTLLGVKHIFDFSEPGIYEDNFPYDSRVEFKLERDNGETNLFKIKTPKKLNAKAFFKGSLKNGDLEIQLTWDKTQESKIDIIIGTYTLGKGVIPLIKFRTNDIEKINLPKKILNELPHARIKTLVVTLIRRNETKIPNNNFLIDNFIAAQSIHNIVYRLD